VSVICGIEGALLGLGTSLVVDVLLNWSEPNIAFDLLLTIAGSIVGLLIGYFFLGNAHEQPLLILVGQAAMAVAAAILVLAMFALLNLALAPRVLLLGMIWGSFPGALIGLYMALGANRVPVAKQRSRSPGPPPSPWTPAGRQPTLPAPNALSDQAGAVASGPLT